MSTVEAQPSAGGQNHPAALDEIEQGNLSQSNLSEPDLKPRNEDESLENGDLSFESHDSNSYSEDLDVSTHFLPAESPTKKRRSLRSSASGDGEDVDKMILEVGEIPDQPLPSPTEIDEIKTALSNRDTLIKKLSSALQKVCKERVQDAELTSRLEEQMKSLREQVKLTKEKAATNRSLKQRNLKLEEERKELMLKLGEAEAEIASNASCIAELEKRKQNNDVSNLSQTATVSSDNGQIGSLVLKHKKDLADLEEKHRKEIDLIEEQRVVEMNMLDAELLTLRDEKCDLIEKLERSKAESLSKHQEFKAQDNNQRILFEKTEKERKLLASKIIELENRYRAENAVRLSLEQNLQEMSSYLDETQYNVLPIKVRESLERSLRLSESFQQRKNLASPPNVTQNELDCSTFPSTDFKPLTELDSTQTIIDESEIIKSIKEDHMKEMSELRKYFENYCQELELRYRNEFEEHLSQLANREGTCLPTVVLPPPLSLDISQGRLDLSELESISPRSLDSSQLNSLGYQGHLSGQDSDGGQFNYKQSLSVEASPRKPKDKVDAISSKAQDALHSLTTIKATSQSTCSPKIQRQLDLSSEDEAKLTSVENKRLSSDGETAVKDQASDVTARLSSSSHYSDKKVNPSLTAEISRLSIENSRLVEDLKHRDREISVLKEKVTILEKEVSKLEKVIFEEDARKYDDVVETLKQQHLQELHNVNSEHEAQVKELLESHQQENDRVKSECARDLENLRLEHAQQLECINNAHRKESNEIRLEKLRSDGEVDSRPPIVSSLENDLKEMEAERENLKSMQTLMKGLISDLALHYSLSEKQVQFLNNTSLLDSFLEGKSAELDDTSMTNPSQTPWKFFPSSFKNKLQTESEDISRLREEQGMAVSPNQSILSMEELSNLIHNGTFLSELENSEQVLKDLQRQVRQSNSVLGSMEPGSLLSKLSGLLTPPEPVEQETNKNLNQECGKLEVEKMRLELELAAAKQRLQELELGTSRNSYSKDEIMSGVGGDSSVENNESRMSDEESFREVREKASKLLSEVEGRVDSVNNGDLIDVLGQLLLYSDQLSTRSKVQVDDLTQQLDVADKQLRSTRQFLEEQAAEREQEREEWENKLTLAKSNQGSAKPRYTEEYNHQEENKSPADTSDEKQDETRGDYDALVEKVFQLREIIRTLENDVEEKSKTVERKCSEVDELRTALMESLMKQESVQKELDNLKNSSTDKEMIDLIEGLKEQLKTKSQELMGHRAAQQHLSDVKAHIRGLQERVEQSTRELETSVLGHDSTTTTASPSSSRSSSPINVMMKSGVSFEDVGAVEIEEVARLEKKLVHQEKVEASAVKKIQDLESEINYLKSQLQLNETDKKKFDQASQDMEIFKEKIRKIEEEYKDEKKTNAKLETELMALKGLNVEDLQAENSVLQDRVVSLQFQVSTLQAEKQASKHRKPSQSSEMEIIIKERAELDELLEKTKDTVRILELERDALQERCNRMMERIQELETDLDSVYTNKEGAEPRTSSMDRMIRDKAELEEMNTKLLKELSQARASVLAAQKVKISKIADDLIREKNAEIDSLKQQLNEMSKGVPLSIESASPGSWKANMSPRSVEQLRDAPSRSLPRIPELSLHRTDYMSNKMPSPLTEHFEEEIDNTLNLRSPKRSPRLISGSSPKLFMASSSSSRSGGKLSGTQSESIQISQPVLEFTREEHGDLPDSMEKKGEESQKQLEEKCLEIEKLRNSQVTSIEEIKKLSEELAQSKMHAENAAKEMEIQIDRIAALEREIKEYKELYSTEKNTVESMQNHILSMESILKEKEHNIQDLNHQLIIKENSMTKLSSQLTLKQEKIESLETKSLDGAEPNLAEEVRHLREELEDRIRGMENLHSVMEMTESELEDAKKNESLWREKYESLQKSQEGLSQSNKDKIQELNGAIVTLTNSVETVTKEKEKTESDLARVNREMAAVDAVVKEMTSQFKAESQIRLKEVQELQDAAQKYKEREEGMHKKYGELEIKHAQLLEELDEMQSQLNTKNIGSVELNRDAMKLAQTCNDSFDKLSRSLNKELELTSELDQSLLNQLISANTSLNSTDEPTEIQRLLHKIQVDGVRVLTLSERLFLTNQVHDEKMKKSLENKSVQEANRKLELMKFDIEHEKAINKDLQAALESEKQNSLDLLSKLSQERKTRNNLEDELSTVQRQVRSLETKLRNANYAVDSDNAEHMITIEAQKEQIESLEESLKMERDNFNQLQNVLAVERKRSSQQRDVAQERRDEEDITELRNQLRTERHYREQLEANLGTGKSGEVAKLIISRLHAELDTEHRKVRDLTARLNQEKKKYTTLYHDLKYQNTESQQSSEVGSVDNYDDSWNRVWRTRELELERLVAELELKVEMLETSNSQNSETIANLQIQLQEERERDNSGISGDQLERMKQVNAFLEHNLKENSEMLATISRLQEERHDLRSKLHHAKFNQSTASSPLESVRQGEYYSKFLRSESFRKALIWQKKYLLVQISGGYFVSEPVMRVNHPHLVGVHKFKAVVHVVVSILRMKYLVKRWRTGKRSSSTKPPGGRDRTLSLQHGSLDSRSLSSMSKKRPDTLSVVSMETQSLVSSPIVHQPRSHGLRRASSLRERPIARSVDSPLGSVSSTSSALYRPPVVTGRTPPTRDLDSRSRPIFLSHHQRGGSTPRRSLDGWFHTDDLGEEMEGVVVSGLDGDLAADLREYQHQYTRLEKQLGIKF